MRILNLTQHPASPEQIEAGVIEPDEKQQVCDLLTFTDIPSVKEILQRADALAQIASEYGVDYAMIGGAGYLMSALEDALRAFPSIEPLHAFTRREVVEEGLVKKTAVFRHVGFVETSDW